MEEIKRVNVGSGPNCIMPDGWVNVDIRDFPGVDRVMDVTETWAFNNLEYIFCEHFIEHLHLVDTVKFLVNAGNSLQTGGKIRLSTPNLEWVIKTHFALDAVDNDKRINDTLKTNRAFHGWGHKFLWSKEFLIYVLESIGYVNLKLQKYGESNDSNLNNLERHSYYESGGLPCVIVVEAEKGECELCMTDELSNRIIKEFVRHVESGH